MKQRQIRRRRMRAYLRQTYGHCVTRSGIKLGPPPKWIGVDLASGPDRCGWFTIGPDTPFERRIIGADADTVTIEDTYRREDATLIAEHQRQYEALLTRDENP